MSHFTGDNQETNLLMKAAIGGDPEIVKMVLKKLRETIAAGDGSEGAMQVCDYVNQLSETCINIL